jgi:hypothetical protein
MAKVIAQHLWESTNPEKVKLSGNKNLNEVIDQALGVIAVLASHGNKTGAGIESAFKAGAAGLGAKPSTQAPAIEDWTEFMDTALPALDQLKPTDKEVLVRSLIGTVMADSKVAVQEMELLRVICSVIHVPIPMITGGEA